MSVLQRLKAELEAQTDAFTECFAKLAELDPELQIAVSPEWMAELSADPVLDVAPVPWAVRV